MELTFCNRPLVCGGDLTGVNWRKYYATEERKAFCHHVGISRPELMPPASAPAQYPTGDCAPDGQEDRLERLLVMAFIEVDDVLADRPDATQDEISRSGPSLGELRSLMVFACASRKYAWTFP